MKVPKKGTVVSVAVTDTDIERGAPSECRACPIALAIKRALNPRTVVVYDTLILLKFVDDETVPLSVKTPAKAAFFIQQFDAGKTVGPFTFQLPLPKTLALLRRGR